MSWTQTVNTGDAAGDSEVIEAWRLHARMQGCELKVEPREEGGFSCQAVPIEPAVVGTIPPGSLVIPPSPTSVGSTLPVTTITPAPQPAPVPGPFPETTFAETTGSFPENAGPFPETSGPFPQTAGPFPPTGPMTMPTPFSAESAPVVTAAPSDAPPPLLTADLQPELEPDSVVVDKPPAAPKKKGRGALFAVVGLMSLFLVGGGAFAAYWFLLRGAAEDPIAELPPQIAGAPGSEQVALNEPAAETDPMVAPAEEPAFEELAAEPAPEPAVEPAPEPAVEPAPAVGGTEDTNMAAGGAAEGTDGAADAEPPADQPSDTMAQGSEAEGTPYAMGTGDALPAAGEPEQSERGARGPRAAARNRARRGDDARAARAAAREQRAGGQRTGERRSDGDRAALARSPAPAVYDRVARSLLSSAGHSCMRSADGEVVLAVHVSSAGVVTATQVVSDTSGHDAGACISGALISRSLPPPHRATWIRIPFRGGRVENAVPRYDATRYEGERTASLDLPTSPRR